MQNEEKVLCWETFLEAYNRLEPEEQVLLAGGLKLTQLYRLLKNSNALHKSIEVLKAYGEEYENEISSLYRLKALIERAENEHLTLQDAAAVVTDNWGGLSYDKKKEFICYLMADEQFREIVEDVIYGE